MKWRVTLLGARDQRHEYDVDTGWSAPQSHASLMRERNEAVKRARQLHRAATGKPGTYADMDPIDWTIPRELLPRMG